MFYRKLPDETYFKIKMMDRFIQQTWLEHSYDYYTVGYCKAIFYGEDWKDATIDDFVIVQRGLGTKDHNGYFALPNISMPITKFDLRRIMEKDKTPVITQVTYYLK